MVYLRVTAEGRGDNGQALNDATDSPQVNSLHPRARDYAVAQRGQHYLQHQQQEGQRDRGGDTRPGCGTRERGEEATREEGERGNRNDKREG